MSRKRFTSEKTANSFANAVGGQVNDCRNNADAKSNFTVTYMKNDSTREYANKENQQLSERYKNIR